MNEIDIVKEAVLELVRLRRSFTGEEVYHRIHNRRIRRANSLDVSQATPREVSRIVRKLFNSGSDVFEKYGSCLTNREIGPILYFPLPAHAKRRAQIINGVLVAVQLVATPMPAPVAHG